MFKDTLSASTPNYPGAPLTVTGLSLCSGGMKKRRFNIHKRKSLLMFWKVDKQ